VTALPAAPAPPRLLLASASPRRRGILDMLGIPHEVVLPALDEAPLPGEAPEALVLRLALGKAREASLQSPGALVLGGDTEVVLDQEVLGKPQDAEDAVRILMRLAGREHRVMSGLALVRDGREVASGVSVTRVFFRPFDEALARGYAATSDPLDKAGGYGIQGPGAALIAGIEGDYWNVVGLPVPLLLELLERAGRPFAFPRTAGAGPAPNVDPGG